VETGGLFRIMFLKGIWCRYAGSQGWKTEDKKMAEIKKLSDDEIENVSGGTEEECAEIVALFRKYGFNKEAKRLNGRVYSMEWALKDVLADMGYTGRIEVYGTDEGLNTNFIDGGRANHSRVLEALDDFLYKKANNIEEM
jgi:hypothetical protein